MIEVKFKLQSLNDIITNSSTEIITTITDDAVNMVRDMVNGLMKVGGSRYCFDDLFTISTYWDRENEWEDLGYDSKEEYIERLEDRGGDLDGASSGKSYVVRAKDPKNAEAAKLLTNLQNMVDSFEYYS